jgi:protein-disulfide isomerase
LTATALAVACGHSGTSSAATRSPGTTASASGIVATSPPQDTISSRADRGRILGDSTATVWVIMASDFQCPYCKTWHDTQFQQLMNSYVKTGRVRLAFLNMPLSMHANAVPAAEAAMCAAAQNKFWPMHEALFATQAAWETMPDPRARFDSIATANGVDMPPWRTCVANHLTRPLIQADHDRATARGVYSTPTFFVGNQTLAGAEANLAPAIDAALAKSGYNPGS